MGMKLSIYLSEDNIRIVVGKAGRRVVIKSAERIDLKKGSLINDVLIDEESVRNTLLEICRRYKRYSHNVHLVLGSSQVLSKVMEVPQLSKYHLLELTKKEMANYSNDNEEYVFDYSVIKRHNDNNEGGTILCAGVHRAVIEQFLKLFSECGMVLKSIDIAANSMVHIIAFDQHFRKSTFILTVADGRNMLSSLYVNGHYTYTSRIRLLSERESPEFSEEVNRYMTSIVRFNQAQKTRTEIEHIYFCGLHENETGDVLKNVSEVIGVPVDVLTVTPKYKIASGCDYDLAKYIYATGNLFER